MLPGGFPARGLRQDRIPSGINGHVWRVLLPQQRGPYFLGYADERGAGEGEGYTRNFPLPRGTSWEEYSTALDAAMDTLAGFSPDALGVSLGVDTYEGDPISAFKLAAHHFPLMGERLAALKGFLARG